MKRTGRTIWKRLLVSMLIVSMLLTDAVPSLMGGIGTAFAAEQEVPTAYEEAAVFSDAVEEAAAVAEESGNAAEEAVAEPEIAEAAEEVSAEEVSAGAVSEETEVTEVTVVTEETPASAAPGEEAAAVPQDPALLAEANAAVDIPVNTYNAQDSDPFHYNSHELIIEQSGSYRLFNGPTGNLTTLSVRFEFEPGDTGAVTLLLDNIQFGSVAGLPAFDFTGVTNATLKYKGGVTVNGKPNQPAFYVPDGVTLNVLSQDDGVLNVTVNSGGIGFGTMTGDPGAVNFGAGKVTISADGKLAMGVKSGSSNQMAVTVASAESGTPAGLEITGGDYGQFVLRNVALTAGTEAELAIYDKTEYGTAWEDVDISGAVLQGKLQDMTEAETQMNLVKGSETTRVLTVPSQYYGFLVNVPAAGRYSITGTDPDGKILKYKGTVEGGSAPTTVFNVAAAGSSYYDITAIFSPVFREDGIVEESLTEGVNISLWGEVDTVYNNSIKTYTGSQPISAMGFALFEVEDGEESDTPVLYQAEDDDITVPEDVTAPTHGGKFTVQITGLKAGVTYHAKPYVSTDAEAQVISDLYYVNDFDLTGSDAVLKFTTPKIEYPVELEMTYGTTVDNALNAHEFTAEKGKTVESAGVSITFGDEAESPFGSNITGRYDLYKRTGTSEADYVYTNVNTTVLPATGTEGAEYFLRFNPGETSIYLLDYKSVTVIVNKKEVSVADVACKTKVYDGTVNAASVIGTISLDGVVIGDEQKISVTASAAVFDSKDTTATKITLSGLTLSGTAASNYVLASETADIDGAEITKRVITLKPVQLTKWAGEKFEPLQMEVTAGTLANGEAVNGNVVPAYTETYEAAGTGSYFVNVPGQNEDIGPSGTGKDYTVSLDKAKLNQDSLNYDIETETVQFKFQAEYPAEGTNFTIPQEKHNGWYTESAVITPKSAGLPAGSYAQGYDQVQLMTGPSTTQTGNDWEETHTVDATGSVYIRLKNSTTGAYTYINQTAIDIRIDKDKPLAEVTGFRKKSDSSAISGFLAKTLGSFYNETVIVDLSFNEVNKQNGSSGLGKFAYSYDGGKTYTDGTLNGSGSPMMSATGSFEIPLKQNGEVTCYVEDVAGNRYTFDVKADPDGSNVWIIENTRPTVNAVKVYSAGTETEVSPAFTQDGNISWYNTAVDVYAVIQDTAGTGEAASGLYGAIWNDGSDHETPQGGFETLTDGPEEVKLKTFSTDSTLEGDAGYVSVKAKDNAGNETANAVTKYIKIDCTEPVLSDLTQSPAAGTMTNGDVTVSFTASDAGSGIKSITWAFCATEDGTYGEENVLQTTATSFTPDRAQNVNGWYRVTVTDQAGNPAAKKIHVQNVDRLAPSISSLAVTAPALDTGMTYYKSDVTLTLAAADAAATATDAKSGLKEYKIKVNDGDWQTPVAWTENAASMTISFTENGSYTVKALVYDKAGNVSGEESVSFGIDKADPVLSVTAVNDAASADAWTKENVSFTLSNSASNVSEITWQMAVSANDGTDWSGWQDLASLPAAGYEKYSWDASAKKLTVSSDLNSNVRFRLVSESGRTSAVQPAAAVGYRIRITKTVPAIPGFESVPAWKEGWFNKNGTLPVLTFTASAKAGTDLAEVTTYVSYKKGSADASEFTMTSGNTKVFDFGASPAAGSIGLENGDWTIEYWAKDAAGNESQHVSMRYKVDNEVPAAGTVTYKYLNNSTWVDWALNKLTGGVFFNRKIQVTVPVTDNVSGAVKLEYSFNNGTDWSDQGAAVLEDGNAVFEIPMDTQGIIRFRITDAAGNTATPVNLGAADGILWILEDEAPIINDFVFRDLEGNTLAPVTKHGSDWFTEAVDVSVLVTDDRSAAGVAQPDLGDHFSGLKSVVYTLGNTSGTKDTYSGRTGNDTITARIDYNGLALPLSVEAEDNATNQAVKKTGTFNVDLSAPSVILTARETAETVDTADSFDLTFTVTDASSGVKNVSVQTWVNSTLQGTESFVADGAPVSGKNVESVTGGFKISVTAAHNAVYKVVAEDWVEHSADLSETVTNIDKKAPDITEFKVTDPEFDADQYYYEALPLTLEAEDVASEDGKYKASGIKKYRVQSRENGAGDNAWADTDQTLETSAQTVTTLTANQNGINDYRLAVEDAVGNVSYSTFLTVKLDTGAPVLKDWAVDDAHGTTEWTGTDNGWISGKVRLRMYTELDASTEHSWLVSRDGGEFVDPAASGYGTWTSAQETRNSRERTVYTLEIQEEGKHTYQFRIKKTLTQLYTDSKTYTVKIDKTVPNKPAYQINNAANTGTWYGGSTRPEIELTQTADTAGGANEKAPLSSSYKLYKDGTGTATPFPADGKVTIPSDGIWSLDLWTEDAAVVSAADGTNNESVHETGTVKVDITKPSIGTITVEKTDESKVLRFLTFGNYGNAALKVTVPVTDETSMPASLSYEIETVGSGSETGTATTVDTGATRNYVFQIPVGTADSAVTVTAKDAAGNETTGIVRQSGEKWTVETDAPTASLVIKEGTVAYNGWYNYDSDITLEASVSDTSGLYSVDYVKNVTGTDSTEHVLEPSGSTKTVSKEFSRKFQRDGTEDSASIKAKVKAVDNAGNEVTTAEVTFKLDTVKPSIAYKSGNPAAWKAEEQTLAFEWSDATSGLDQNSLVIKKYNVDVTEETGLALNKTDGGFTIKTMGNGVYTASVKDNAGNEASDSVTVTKIDTVSPVLPTVEVKVGDAAVTDGSVITGKPTIKIIVAAKPTVSEMTTMYVIKKGSSIIEEGKVIDEAKTVDLTSKIGDTVDSDGVWTIETGAINQAQVQAGPATFTFTLDRFAPVLPGKSAYSFKKVADSTASTLNRLTFGLFFKEQAKIAFTLKDYGEAEGKANTGVKEMYYKLSEQEGSFTEADLTMTAKKDGYEIVLPSEKKTYLYYYIVDNAGNKTAVTKFDEDGIALLLSDSTKPVISAITVTESEASAAAYAPNGDGWYNKAVWLKALADDTKNGSDASGLNKVVWTSGGQEVKLLDAPNSIVLNHSINRKVDAEGTTEVVLSAADNAGNAAVEKSAAVSIDTVAPVVEKKVTDEYLSAPSNESKTVEMQVSDATSEAVSNDAEAASPYEYIIVRRVKDENGQTITSEADQKTVLTIEAVGTETSSATGKKHAPSYKFEWMAEANGEYTVQAKDLAGNVSEVQTVVVSGIDKSGIDRPVVTINGKTPDQTGWYAVKGADLVFLITNKEHDKQTKVSWAFGTGSGESGRPADGYTDIADGADGVGTVNPSITADGVYYLWVKALRNTGADPSYDCYTIHVDTTKPSVSKVVISNPDGMDGTQNWTNGNQTVGVVVVNTKAQGASACSDIKAVEVKLNGADVVVTSGTISTGETGYNFTAEVNGTYQLTVTDGAGNKVSKDIVIDHIDKTEPAKPAAEIINETAGSPASDWTKTRPSVKITRVTAGAGEAPVTTKYSLVCENGTKIEGDLAQSEKTVEFSGDGVWSWTVWSEDEAGNKSDSAEGTLKVDTVAPVMTGVGITTVNDTSLAELGRMLTFGSFFKEAVKVTVNVTDEQTGITVSGNYQLQYTIGSGEEKTAEISNGKAVFTIPLETTASQVRMTVTDRCGTKSGEKYLVRNAESSDAALGSAAELWTVDATKPEISAESFTISSEAALKNGYYNKDVIFDAAVSDEESGINNVFWTYAANGGKETVGTKNDTYGSLAAITRSVSGVKQTISTEGVVSVDFLAENNAGVKAALSEKKEPGSRTVRIDKTAPVIAYVSGNPAAWTAEEQTIFFTVTDTAAEGASEHSGVDNGSVKVKRLVNGSIPEKEITVTTVTGSGDARTYSFVTEGNADYEITASDLAGNAAEKQSVKVQFIDASVPGAPAKNDTTGKDGSASYAVSAYYTEVPEITIRSSVNYVIKKEEKNTAPVITCYQIYREGDSDPETFEVKSLENGTVPVSVSQTASEKISQDTARDGRWILKVWNKTAAGKTSEVIEESFFIDRVKPEIEAIPVAVKADDKDVYELLNRLTFGVFFNRALTVTVRVKDVTSYGSELKYRDSATGTENTVPITLDKDDPTVGTADIILPIHAEGQAFSVSMRASDKAGNMTAEEEAVKLAVRVDGGETEVWVLENELPAVEYDATRLLDTERKNPKTAEEEIDFRNTAYIRLTFNEFVRPVADGRVRIVTGSDFYYADLSTADITTGPEGTEPLGITEPTEETYRENWIVTIPLSEFKKDGEKLVLQPSTSYVVTVLANAFEDIAGNRNRATMAAGFMTMDPGVTPKPVIKDDFTLNVGPEDGVLSPAFDKNIFGYTLLLWNSILDETGEHLKKDLELNMGLEKDVSLGKVQLKNIAGETIWELGKGDITEDGGKISFSVPGTQIRKKSNYYLSLEVVSFGRSSTYSFFISTSAITAKEDTTSGRGGVRAAYTDLDRLTEILYPELLQDALNNWKVQLTFSAHAVSAESVDAEASAAIALSKRNPEVKKYKKLKAYPVEINIEKLMGRNGETEYVRQLPESIQVVLSIPASVSKTLVGIYREHNGVTTEMSYTLNENKTEATIVTDLFSVYTIVYGDNSGGGGGGGGGDSGGVLVINGLNAIYGGTWKNNGKLFVKSDGSKPENQFIRVNGKVYYVGNDGFLAKPVKYSVAEDGSVVGDVTDTVTDMTGTWLNDGWRYTKMDGKDLSNGWAYIIYEGKFDWYYFNEDGWMLDGWFNDGKNTYFLHTVHDRTRGHMYTGWHFINGQWYYFRTKPEGTEGSLLRNGYAADGHYVRADGTWDGRGTAPVTGH